MEPRGDAAGGKFTASNDAAVARLLKGKKKKALRLLAKGRPLPLTLPAGILSAGEADAAAMSAKISVRVHGKRQLSSGVSNEDLQMFILSCLGQSEMDHHWAQLENKRNLGCVVLLLVRGLTWSDWQREVGPLQPEYEVDDGTDERDTPMGIGRKRRVPSPDASASPRSSLTFLSALLSLKLLHRRGRSWNHAVRSIDAMERSLLYLPENAVIMDDKEAGATGGTQVWQPAAGAADGGKKRRREDAGGGRSLKIGRRGEGDQEKAEEEEEEDEEESDVELTASLVTRRVWSLTLTLEEMRAHSFPLPSHPSASGSDGGCCVAGAPPHLAHSCPLSIPHGYMLTRTAHMDLHSVYGDMACPVLAAQKWTEEGQVGEEDTPGLLAIDCEMCLTEGPTGPLYQLARVSAVNGSEELALDEYVKPTLPIRDYLTRYSGVTKALLDANAKMDADTARLAVSDLMDGIETPGRGTTYAVDSSSTSLSPVRLNPAAVIGHSVDNDLNALRIVHTRVIDTSLTRTFSHPSGLPLRFALRNLAYRHLGRVIQAGHGREDSQGHDSAEDAMAVLHLVHMLLFQPGGDVDDDIAAVDHRSATAPVPSFGLYLSRPVRDALMPRFEEPIPSSASAQPVHARQSGSHRGVGVGVATAIGHLFPGGGFDEEEKDKNSEGGEGGVLPASPSVSEPQPVLQGGKQGSAEQGRGNGRQGARGSAARDASRQKQLSRSILALPDMSNKKVVTGVSLVGPPTFLSTHLAGSASGITQHFPYTNPSAMHARSITDKVVSEVKRYASVRAEAMASARARGAPADEARLCRGPGFVIAEVLVPSFSSITDPHAPGYAPDLTTLDQVLAGLANNLPPGSLLVMASQAARLWYTGGRALPQRPGAATGAGALASATTTARSGAARQVGGKNSSAALSSADAAAAAEAKAGVAFFHAVR